MNEAIGPATADDVIARLSESGQTLATAESLTGGLICAELTSVPGASAVILGGVISYSTQIKVKVLGVDEKLIQSRGAVDPEVARQMAIGARQVMGADVGLACTGVAGPDSQDGHAPGLVYVAVARAMGEVVLELNLVGTRTEIRGETVQAALDLVFKAISG